MTPFYIDDKVSLHQGDVLAWALEHRALIDAGEALPFHAILCDPPYGLGDPPPIEKLLTTWLAGDDFAGFSKGFMGKVWDVLPSPQVWRALLDITYPGGYLFAFSGTRTTDLLGIACRLGGWEPFDRIASFAWVQGQGMKKGQDIGKALDKDAGVEREVVTVEKKAAFGYGDRLWKHQDGANENVITAPATPLAQAFDDYGTGIAPKHEPILLFRRPREGRTFAQCAREFGSGGLDIGSCRVRGSSGDGHWTHKREIGGKGIYGGGGYQDIDTGNQGHPAGRWPPNCHFSHVPPAGPCPTCDGSGFVKLSPLTESFKSWYAKTKERGGSREEWQRLREPGGTSICPECHGRGVVGGCRRVGSKRVEVSSKSFNRKTPGGLRGDTKIYGTGAGVMRTEGYADADGKEQVADWECVEGCAVRALDEMAGERKSGGADGKRSAMSGQVWNTKTCGLRNQERTTKGGLPGSTGSASRFYPCHDWSYEIAERLAGETPFKYQAKASRGEREAGCKERPRKFLATMGDGIGDLPHGKEQPAYWVGNNHPTIKPLSLCKWLATLACPPPQFSPRLCVPFGGSGSETIGAILAGGWAEIHAIERELEYCEIAAARVAWWTKWAALTGKTNPAEIRKLAEAAESKEGWQGDERQTSMFEIMEGDKKQ